MAWLYPELLLSPPSSEPCTAGHRRAQHVGSRPAERFFWLLFFSRKEK